MIKKAVFVLCILPFMTACPVMTRSDVKEHEQKRAMQDQVVSLQKTTADVNNRFAEVDSEMRSLYGRIEILENQVRVLNQKDLEANQTLSAKSQEQDSRVKILQDEVARMDAQINALKAEIEVLKATGGSGAGSLKSNPTAKKNSYDLAEELFNQKDWMRAAQAYQKYRDENPKGKNFSEATYKIGVCFQELGMSDEAKTFFDEAIAKFPKSQAARKARIRLKSLKK